jgi:hypothetical protein
MQTILFLIISALCIIVQCSKVPEPEQPDHTYILNEVPPHINEVENLTIFPGDTEPLYSIELIPAQTFGKAGEPFVAQVLGCVEDDKGRVILWNADSNYQQILYVYNADGTYHSQLGRQGKGPGEYGHIVGLQAKAGKVFVLDYTGQRLNEYSTKDYSFLNSILFESWKSDDGLSFGYVEPRKDGNYLLSFSDDSSRLGRQKYKYQVMDHKGNKTHFAALILPAGFRIKAGQSNNPLPTPTMPLTFLGKTITALSNDDGLYTVWTRDFLIKKYNSNGVYQSAIYYPIGGSTFDLNNYTKSQLFSPKARDIKKAFADLDKELPETFPVVGKLLVDDENRIWVAVPAGAQREYYEWWILKESGELLAKLMLPRDQPIYDIKNGHLYSKQTDEKTGSEYVVKYQIRLVKYTPAKNG